MTMRIMVDLWDWHSPAWWIAAAALVVYGVIVRGGANWQQWTCFVVAIAAFILAMASPVAVLAKSYLFSAHMLQHLLLLLIVPMLVLLSLPGFPANVILSEAKDLHQPEDPSRALRMTTLACERVRQLAPLCWLGGVGAMWFWHIPVLCDASLRSNGVYAIQTISLLLAGIAFWFPIFSPRASRRLEPAQSVGYLFSACVGCTLLGIYITFSPISVCPPYHHPLDPVGILPVIRNQWGLTFAADQRLGGLLMWVPSCTVYAAVIMAMMARWYRAEQATEIAA